MKKSVTLFLLCLFLSATVFLYFGNDVLLYLEGSSTRLPSSGVNFESYSRFLSTLGRTHVHSALRPVLLDTYAKLAVTLPTVKWIYGETGWKNGGNFWPHRTHRNGLSVDFIVPVINRDTNEATQLSLWPYNAWGYRTRFDANGHSGSYQIDFKSIILHLKTLDEVGEAHRVRIKRVIFDPPLLELLKRETSFKQISGIEFMKEPAWFPHDSHYHIDFELM